MIKVCHVITSSDVGGAERTLERLLRWSDPLALRGSVVSLLPRGVVADEIEQHGWPVRSLNMGADQSAIGAVQVLRDLLRRDKPDIVQTWMYHADLVGGLAARTAGCRRVVWNVRRTTVFPSHERKQGIRAVTLACVPLSRIVPRVIVCGSHAARASHAAAGYPRAKLRVIPNGIETPTPMLGAREGVRRELGLADDTVLVGRIGRYDPMKDYGTFLEAAALLMKRGFAGQFLLCGKDVCDSNAELADHARSLGILERCRLMGPRADIDRLQASLDVACSSSYSEGFPNVIAEAMALGVPCVATDVGDSALLVGDTGLIVPPRSPGDLAEAVAFLLDAGAETRRRMGAAASERVAGGFSVSEMVNRYEELYTSLMDNGRV